MIWIVVAVAALMLFWKLSLLFEILSRAQEGRTGGVSLMPTVDLIVGGVGTVACVLGDMSPLGGRMASLGLIWGPSIIFFGALAVGILVSRKRVPDSRSPNDPRSAARAKENDEGSKEK